MEPDLAPVHGGLQAGPFISGSASERVSSLPVSLPALQTLAQELPVPHDQLSQLCSQMLQAPNTSPGFLLLPPNHFPVLTSNLHAGPQSTLALPQSTESSLPVHTQSLSETHLEISSFRKPSWIPTTPDLTSLPPALL